MKTKCLLCTALTETGQGKHEIYKFNYTKSY
jgi:hypothetical protein